jgi:hypothetical protein
MRSLCSPRLKAPLVTGLCWSYCLVMLPCPWSLMSPPLSWAPASSDYCAYKFVEVIGSGKHGLEMTSLLRIGRPVGLARTGRRNTAATQHNQASDSLH